MIMIIEQTQKYGNGDWITVIIGTDIYEVKQSQNTTIISSNIKN